MRVRRIWRILVIIVILAVGAYFGFRYIKGISEKEKEEQKKIEQAKNEADAEASVPVKVVPAQKGDLPLRLTVSAVADVREKAAIRTEVEGVVAEVARREGQRVEKGDVIVRLDSSEKQLALREAEANRLQTYSKFLSQYKTYEADKKVNDTGRLELGKNKVEYEQALSRFREGAIGKEEVEMKENALLEKMIEQGALQEEVKRVVSGLTQAELALERARLNLEHTLIRAPFPGTVSEIKISAGEKVSVGTEITRMVNLQSIYLKGYVLETELGKIKAGQGTRIRFLSQPGQFFRGRVSAVSPEINLEKKTGTVFVDFDNPGTVFSGMDAEVDIEYESVKDVVKVPVQSLIIRSGREVVFVVDGDTALWRYVETGARNDEEIEIKSNVTAGEQVVVEGHLTLGHQAKVRILR